MGQTDAFDDLQPKMEIIKKAHIWAFLMKLEYNRICRLLYGADNGSHTLPKNGFMIAFPDSLGQFFGQTWLFGHLSRRV